MPPTDKNAPVLFPVENPFAPADAEYCLNDSNHCYFFNNNHVTILDKEGLLKRPPLPDIYFEHIVADDSLFQLNGNDTALVLPNGYAATLRVSFDIFAFNAAKASLEYRIRREGETTHWESVTGKELNLILPEYGQFTIIARAKTLGGQYSPVKQLSITILKPWWAKWWGITIFIFLSIMAITLLFYFFIRKAVKRKEAEHQAKMRVLNAEFKSLNAMMNPHFIFNTLNNIQGFINTENKMQASEYIRIFSDMIRQIW